MREGQRARYRQSARASERDRDKDGERDSACEREDERVCVCAHVREMHCVMHLEQTAYPLELCFSSAKEPYKRDYILHKRLISLRSQRRSKLHIH